ncbi:MAG: DUF4339 domain-containing protein [Myxococcota bacterium]
MARWLVTQGDDQFSAQDLNELKQLARTGRLGPGDMVQPPGASDWLYATEIPELKDQFPDTSGGYDDDDLDYKPRGSLPQGPIIGILLILVAVVGYGMYYFAVRMPTDEDLEFALGLTELIVTADPAQVYADPDANASKIGTLTKDSQVQLRGKQGEFYAVEKADGSIRGWVSVRDTIAGYQFKDSRTRDDYDPIYNPDRYVFVQNASWMQLPNQREENITNFQFMLKNKSKFEMKDIVLLATIKDKSDRVLEKKEIAIEGSIPAYASVMVGTLEPGEDAEDDAVGQKMTDEMFNKLREDDPELSLRWSLGVNVQMESENFSEANIDLLGLSAVARRLD